VWNKISLGASYYMISFYMFDNDLSVITELDIFPFVISLLMPKASTKKDFWIQCMKDPSKPDEGRRKERKKEERERHK
jgi:hypothetical protein